ATQRTPGTDPQQTPGRSGPTRPPDQANAPRPVRCLRMMLVPPHPTRYLYTYGVEHQGPRDRTAGRRGSRSGRGDEDRGDPGRVAGAQAAADRAGQQAWPIRAAAPVPDRGGMAADPGERAGQRAVPGGAGADPRLRSGGGVIVDSSAVV